MKETVGLCVTVAFQLLATSAHDLGRQLITTGLEVPLHRSNCGIRYAWGISNCRCTVPTHKHWRTLGSARCGEHSRKRCAELVEASFVRSCKRRVSAELRTSGVATTAQGPSGVGKVQRDLLSVTTELI